MKTQKTIEDLQFVLKRLLGKQLQKQPHPAWNIGNIEKINNFEITNEGFKVLVIYNTTGSSNVIYTISFEEVDNYKKLTSRTTRTLKEFFMKEV